MTSRSVVHVARSDELIEGTFLPDEFVEGVVGAVSEDHMRIGKVGVVDGVFIGRTGDARGCRGG